MTTTPDDASDDWTYTKREGTSGVSGQLYESKLLSLALFRALHDDDITDFCLGANLTGVGELDDLCLRFKMKDYDKPIALFLQAKHRDNAKRTPVFTNTDLIKYFKSYLEIRHTFVQRNDAFFRGAYDDVECVYVFYTNTKMENVNDVYEGIEACVINKITDIISEDDAPRKLSYTADDIKLLNDTVLRAKINRLAAVIVNIAIGNVHDYKNVMKDELLTYHVLLAQTILDLTDVQLQDYRIATFKPDLFGNNNETDQYLLLLKQDLLAEAVKNNKPDEAEIADLLSQLFAEPSDLPISKLIGGVIAYDDNTFKFKFIDQAMRNDKELRDKLDKVKVTQLTVARAIDAAGKAILQAAKFKLPQYFGNDDMTLRGSDTKKERRLNYLSTKIVNMLKEAKDFNFNNETLRIVEVDCNFTDMGMLQLNGGLGGAVGNLLVLDENTRLLMFERGDTLKGLAKRLFEKINIEIDQLQKYRFDIKVKDFPKLVFECNSYDESLVVDFTNKLMFYTNQARESEVEATLKYEISRHQSTKEECNFQINSDAIFRSYHDKVQSWWMRPKKATYQTKCSDFFQKASEGFIKYPLLSIANAMHANTRRFHITYKPDVAEAFSKEVSVTKITIIVTEVIALTIMKVEQSFVNNCSLLDLNYILSLPANDCVRLNSELANIKDKIFVLTYNLSRNLKLYKEAKEFLRTLKGKKLIVITNVESEQKINKYLALNSDDSVKINDKVSLTDLASADSQLDTILADAKVVFQGVNVSLNLLFDDDSKRIITGEHLNKIVNGKSISIGAPLTNVKYEEIKDFYMNRLVKKERTKSLTDPRYTIGEDRVSAEGLEAYYPTSLETFYDIKDHIVLIAAKPGMGKSSLLTHLSLNTKARDPKVWIVRMNLLDHSKWFRQWTDNNTTIDIIEAMRFICKILIHDDKKIEYDDAVLKINNGEVVLDECCIKEMDEDIKLVLSMFLHFCNRRKVIFLFDGFDEICPHYETVVIQLLKVVKDFRPRAHRTWVTSRTYDNILDNLQKEFGDSLHLQGFSLTEQQIFIERFMKTKLNTNDLSHEQTAKMNDFISFLARNPPYKEEDGLRNIYTLLKCQKRPLYPVYLNAARYFKHDIEHNLIFVDKIKYLNQWNVESKQNIRHKLFNEHAFDEVQDRYESEFNESPLQLYMIADYLQNEIKRNKHTKWDFDMNTHEIYEKFLENKLIERYREKNQWDLSRPDVDDAFREGKKKFIKTHKRLAAYAIFIEDVAELFNETELKKIINKVNTINLGGERSGVIYAVTDGVPRFVHRTIAECFAVECLCDMLKTELNVDRIEKLWEFILNKVFMNHQGAVNVLDDKLVMDDTLQSVVYDASHRKIILNLLMKQSVGVPEYVIYNYEQIFLKNTIYSSIYQALCAHNSNWVTLFLSTFEFMTKDQIDDLIKILNQTTALRMAAHFYNKDFIISIVNTVIRVDADKIAAMFYGWPMFIESLEPNATGEEIVNSLLKCMFGEAGHTMVTY